MKHSVACVLSIAAILFAGAACHMAAQVVRSPQVSGFKVLQPLHHSNINSANLAEVQQQSSTGSTVPLWSYTIVAGQDGNTYQGQIVGRNPAYNGRRATTVQTYLVPVILTFPDGSVFDPTADDPGLEACYGLTDTVLDLVQNSPVFTTADYTFTDSNGNNPVDVGTTQYADATQLANYWKYIAPSPTLITPYHILVNLNTLSAVSVTVPIGYGFSNPSGCRNYGEMDYNWWDSYVVNTLIPSLSAQGMVGPNNLPIFIFDSVVMYLNGNSTECCALGDHGSYLTAANLLQTYVVADFPIDAQWSNVRPDVATLSDELAKWMNDPTVLNATPPWSSSLGQMANQCENILELGDPLAGYIFPITAPNGNGYSMQEMAYFSWFYDQVPSIGAGGWYSDQGSLTTPAPVGCPAS